MHRSIALIGSLFIAVVLALTPLEGAGAQADANLSIVNAAFVSVEDPSLHALLERLAAALTWHAGDPDVLVTTANHAVIAFRVGEREYHVGTVSAQARYAPYLKGSIPYLPLTELLSALSLRGFPNGRTLLLEPLISSLEVRTSLQGSSIVAQAAMPLTPRLVSQDDSTVTYAFDGVGSSVAGTRSVDAGGVRSVSVRSTGTLQTAQTLVTVNLEPHAIASDPQSDDGRDFLLPIDAQSQEPAPAASFSETRVTAVDVMPASDAFTVDVVIAGDATYEWHRLAAPDNRFWIDIRGAQLSAPPRDDVWTGTVTGVRVSQQTPTVVRIALSLTAHDAIDVVPSADGVRVIIHDEVAADAPHAGSGSIGTTVAATVERPPPSPSSSPTSLTTQLVTPVPVRQSYVPTNPKLIVIDPGHGGDDPGTVNGNAQEKTFTLDIAKRLRAVLIARGWQVKMTRETDTEVDPVATTDHDELQARDDVANANGARIFISIHVNAYSQPGPNGTTTYYSKPEDVPLANDVQSAIASRVGMKDDGIVKMHFYVTLHARMPAVLVETAFITNPGDLARLESPAWRQRMAEAMADGIERYARENPLPPAPTQ